MASEAKKIEKLGCVIPYQVWEVLKGHPPALVVDVIDLLIRYDHQWQECQEKGIDILGKMTPSVAMAFSFVRPMIDANNNKYFHRVKTNRKNAESSGRKKKTISGRNEKTEALPSPGSKKEPEQRAAKPQKEKDVTPHFRKTASSEGEKAPEKMAPDIYDDDYDYIPNEAWEAAYNQSFEAEEYLP